MQWTRMQKYRFRKKNSYCKNANSYLSKACSRSRALFRTPRAQGALETTQIPRRILFSHGYIANHLILTQPAFQLLEEALRLDIILGASQL